MRQPKSIQIAYYAHLRRIVKGAKSLIDSKLIPVLPMLMERNNPAAYRADFFSRPDFWKASFLEDALPPGKRVNHIIEAVKKQASKMTAQKPLERITNQIGNLVAQHNERQLGLLGVDPPLKGTPKAVAAFTAENVSLIRTIPADYFADVEKVVHQAMAQGLRHEAVISTLQQRYGVTESRAKLIARDQVLKFNGSMNKLRQTNAGVTKYVWRTVEDERTREVHAEFDGTTYDWSDPPGDGSAEEGTHPGTAINCRCWADPVIEDAEESPADPENIEEPDEPASPPVEPENPPVQGTASEDAFLIAPKASEVFGSNLQVDHDPDHLAFHQAALESLNLVPKQALELVAKEGVKIHIGKGSVADLVPHLANQKGQVKGRGWNVVSGVFDIDSKTTVVGSLEPGRAGYAMLHEFGHALDWATGGELSGSDEFRKTWSAWVSSLTPEQRKYAGYFTDKIHGPSETFADLYFHTLNGAKSTAEKSKFFDFSPELKAHVKAALKDRKLQ